MGFVGKVPLALAAGLSVSGVLASQVAPQMTWPQAMGMCVMYGVVICLLVVTGLREMIMNAIPSRSSTPSPWASASSSPSSDS